MNPTTASPKTAFGTPLPDLTRLVSGLGHITRWKMLKELSGGEARSIDELAKVSGCTYANAAKHLISLRAAGLIVQGRGRLYNIPKQYLPSPGEAVVDYGHCLLRLDAAG
jgi:predicted transcriptional regulator